MPSTEVQRVQVDGGGGDVAGRPAGGVSAPAAAAAGQRDHRPIGAARAQNARHRGAPAGRESGGCYWVSVLGFPALMHVFVFVLACVLINTDHTDALVMRYASW